MLYELNHIKKIYNQRTVLDLNSLCINENKVYALLGPNGSGKTTLLEILAFLIKPSTGNILFNNLKAGFNNRNILSLHRKIVLIQQHPILFSTTVSKNIEFPLKIRKTPKAKQKKIIKELLSLVGMEAFENTNAFKLSGGETQRVAIAQALACSPEVILMDEPTSSVDVENKIVIEHIILKINQEKRISVIFTTHDMIQASRLADKTIFLFEGKVAKSIYENLFSGHIIADDKGRKYCVINSDLKLPVNSDKAGHVRISIDPCALKLNNHSNKECSLHYNLKGTLMQLSKEQNNIRALVDVGIPLSVLIPMDEFKNLELVMGEEVRLGCPKESIEIF